MPVEHMIRICHVFKKIMFKCSGCKMYGKYTYLLFIIWINAFTQCIRNELCAKANANTFLSRFDGLKNKFLLIWQPGVFLFFINIHSAAHHQ